MFLSRRSCRLTCAVLALVCVANRALAEAPTWRFNGTADLGYDSNTGNAPDGLPRTESLFAETSLAVSRRWPLHSHVSALVRGTASVQAYEAVSGLGNAKATALLRLSARPGDSPLVPTFSLWGSGAAWEFQSDIRDSTELRAGILVQQPLTTRLSTRLSGVFAQRDSDSRVFDLQQRWLAVDLEWQPWSAARLALGWQLQDGDTVATAPTGFGVVRSADQVEPDEAYGGMAGNRYAYRLKARTQVGSLGFNYRLSQQLSLDTQLQHAQARSERWDTRYRRWVLNTGLLWRFGL